MGLLQELFHTHGPAYLAQFGSAMPSAHKKVIAAIIACRTEATGATLYECAACGHRHVVPRACGNRHCPGCQQGKGRRWLERHQARHLPGEHFLLTFTVPEPLRAFLRRHQKIGYGALFEASSGAIKTLAADPKYIGGDLAGFFGVLHTWGRTLQYHPHIHYVVPGGALSREDPAGVLFARARPVEDLSGQGPRRHRRPRAARGDAGRGLVDGVERQLPGRG